MLQRATQAPLTPPPTPQLSAKSSLGTALSQKEPPDLPSWQLTAEGWTTWNRPDPLHCLMTGLPSSRGALWDPTTCQLLPQSILFPPLSPQVFRPIRFTNNYYTQIFISESVSQGNWPQSASEDPDLKNSPINILVCFCMSVRALFYLPDYRKR